MKVDPTSVRAGFAFPGMGVGMSGGEARLFARHRETMEPFLRQASECAGADLSAALAGGGPRGLDSRQGELFTYAASCALGQVVRDRGVEPLATAGLSLGLYAALWAAGSISFEGGLRLVEGARAAMDARLDPDEPAGMGAVVGLEPLRLEGLLADGGYDTVRLANSMSPLAHVYSGIQRELSRFLAEAEAAGALRTVLLEVDTPFHSPLLLKGVDQVFRGPISEVSWCPPRCPVISSIDGAPLREVAALQDLTARNLSTPIRWQQVVEVFAHLGVEVVIECGPGTSLTQNAAFVEGAPRHLSSKTLGRGLDL